MLKNSGKIFLIILASALILNFDLLFSYAAEHKEAADLNKEYVIAPNDLLEVAVYEEPDLSVTVRVSQNGTINYPLLGNVKASGLSVCQLQDNIRDMLEKDFLVNPQINVFVKEYAKVSILGQVAKPGSYEMKERLTLTQAIALAGGFTETANTKSVKVICAGAGKRETLEVDMGRILSKSAPDTELKAGDTVIVEEAGQVSIIGQVMRPGIYNLKPGLTVVDAIALAGGFTPIAAQDGVKVIRMLNGGRKTIRVPVASILRGGDKSRDIVLEPDDTIVAPESFF
jgi:polysaccharide export outer membrane protein